MVDSVLVGQFLGKQSLSAVGQSFPVVFACLALATGIACSGPALFARSSGAQKSGSLQILIDALFAVSGWLSLAVTMIGFFFAPAILCLMQTPRDVVPQAVLYLRILFLGTFAIFSFNTVASVQRFLGDAKTPVHALIAAAVANIVFDVVFIVLLHRGVGGAAAATVLAQFVALGWTLVAFRKRFPDVRVRFFSFRPDRAMAGTIAKRGLPSGARQFLVAAGLMTVTGVVNGFGTNPSAAFFVASRLDWFVLLPAMNLGFALSAFAAQNREAGLNGRVRRGLIGTLLLALGFSLAVALAVSLSGKSLMGFFCGDPEVVRTGAGYLGIAPIGYVLQAVTVCLYGCFEGAGLTLFTLVMPMVSMWLVRVPCAVVLSRFFGTSGIWWSFVIAGAASLIGILLRQAYRCSTASR